MDVAYRPSHGLWCQTGYMRGDCRQENVPTADTWRNCTHTYLLQRFGFREGANLPLFVGFCGLVNDFVYNRTDAGGVCMKVHS